MFAPALVSRSCRMVICALLCFAAPAHADLFVGPGSTMSLANGAMDLGCTDIRIAGGGVLNIDSVPVTGVRNVTIDAGGFLTFGTGSIAFAGAFVNNGEVTGYNAGSLIQINNRACAPDGPSITGLFRVIPALDARMLAFLALMLACWGGMQARRQVKPGIERE